MKKSILLIIMACIAFGCSKFDDSAIWTELNKHADRIADLEVKCSQMNTNILSMQTIVSALQSKDYITNVTEITSEGEIIGYTITFAQHSPITIYHGQDGENGKDGANGTDGKDGTNGANGKDGKDGYTPQIGVKRDVDGCYYWTLDGEWMLDAVGNKIKAEGKDGATGSAGEDGKDGTDGANGKDGNDGADGTDGKDGVNGKDGITPQLKIEEGYWYVSYDNGNNWTQLGKATGEDGADGVGGADGADGDSFFDDVAFDEDYAYFTLSNGITLQIPLKEEFNGENSIRFEDKDVKAVLLANNVDTNYDGEISYNEAAAVKTIGTMFKGNENIAFFNEFKYFTGIETIVANAFSGSSIVSITIPRQLISIGASAFSGSSLSRISFEDNSSLEIIKEWAFLNSKIRHITIPNSVVTIESYLFYGTSIESIEFEENSILMMIPSNFVSNNKTLKTIKLPASVSTIKSSAFKDCVALEKVSFAEKSMLTTIEKDAFSGQSEMSTKDFAALTFDASNCSYLSQLGDYIFPENMQSIILSRTTPPTATSNSFKFYADISSYMYNGAEQTSISYGNNYKATLYVPQNSIEKYKSTSPWNNFTSIISIDEYIEE